MLETVPGLKQEAPKCLSCLEQISKFTRLETEMLQRFETGTVEPLFRRTSCGPR